MVKRLKLFLNIIKKERKFNIKILSEEIRIPYRTLQDYFGGISTPSIDLANRLHEMYDLNINWLLSGKGPMFNKTIEDDFTSKDPIDIFIHTVQSLLDNYKIPQNEKELIESLLNYFSKRN